MSEPLKKEIDEHCLLTKMHASEVAYDRTVYNVARKNMKKHKDKEGSEKAITVGGMFSPESGFVPGPPSRTKIPLYFYDPDHTPHWGAGEYNELGDTEITAIMDGTASHPTSGVILIPQGQSIPTSYDSTSQYDHPCDKLRVARSESHSE